MTKGLWMIADHACRECFGRIVVRMDGPAAGTYRCVNCGVESADAVESLCACGLRLKTDQRDMAFRCVVNPKRSPEFPAEIVITRIRPEDSADALVPVQTVIPLRFLKS